MSISNLNELLEQSQVYNSNFIINDSDIEIIKKFTMIAPEDKRHIHDLINDILKDTEVVTN